MRLALPWSVLLTLSTWSACTRASPRIGLLQPRAPAPAMPAYSVVSVIDPEADIPGNPPLSDNEDNENDKASTVTITVTKTHSLKGETVTHTPDPVTTTVVTVVDVQETERLATTTVTVYLEADGPDSQETGDGSGSALPPAETFGPVDPDAAVYWSPPAGYTEDPSTSPTPYPETPTTTLSTSLIPVSHSTAPSGAAPTSTGQPYDDGMWHGQGLEQGLWNGTATNRFRRH